jgi:hypothetical protein
MLERTAARFPLFAGHASFFAEANSCFEKLTEEPLQFLRSKRQPRLSRAGIVPVVFLR